MPLPWIAPLEDVAQSSWVKLLEAIETGNFKEKQLANPSAYLYQIVNETVRAETKKYRGLTHKRVDGRYDFVQEHLGDLPVTLIAAPTPSPDETLELRLNLLQYIQTYLFEAIGNQRRMRRRLEELMGAMVGSGAEDVLSEALIKYFVMVVKIEGREAAGPQLIRWNALANEVLGSSLEFELALRVLGTIIRYLNTNDKRSFLDLRLEERAFVETPSG